MFVFAIKPRFCQQAKTEAKLSAKTEDKVSAKTEDKLPAKTEDKLSRRPRRRPGLHNGEGLFEGLGCNGVLISQVQAEDILADDKSEAEEQQQYIQDLSKELESEYKPKSKLEEKKTLDFGMLNSCRD